MICFTPSYDGKNTAMHPKVLDLNWNGYRYWMIETPDAAVHECPTILASQDGIRWTDIKLLVTPPTDLSFYSDPHLVFKDGILYSIYRFTEKTRVTTFIITRESTDGINWSDEKIIISGTGSETRCPCILWDGKFIMWTAGDKNVQMRTCSNIYGEWPEPIDCSGANPWHMDVIRFKDIYLMIGTDGKDKQYLGKSKDGINWDYGSLFMTRSRDNWDKDGLYRASIVQTETGVDIWYSGLDETGWHIGKTSATMI
jgi:hypothetical protein